MTLSLTSDEHLTNVLVHLSRSMAIQALKKRKRGDAALTVIVCGVDDVPSNLAHSDFDAIFSISNPSGDEKYLARIKQLNDQMVKNCNNTAFYVFYDNPNGTSKLNRGKIRRAVENIIERAKKLENGDLVLVNCSRGRCRSAAAAIILYKVFFSESWQEATDRLMNLYPSARPDHEMLESAKRMLS